MARERQTDRQRRKAGAGWGRREGGGREMRRDAYPAGYMWRGTCGVKDALFG